MPTATSTSRARSPTSSGCRRRTRRASHRRAPGADCRGSASPTRPTRCTRRSTAPSRHRTAGTSARSSKASRRSARAGLGTDILSKLRRGHWSVQAELDLHGQVTRRGARRAGRFPRSTARQRGLRCVRVIHGKGLTSPNREPVLKGKTRRWLAHWDDVLAYVEAPQHAGGGGALLVLLRGEVRGGRVSAARGARAPAAPRGPRRCAPDRRRRRRRRGPPPRARPTIPPHGSISAECP